MRRCIDILLPTCNRRSSLIATLAGVAGQTLNDIRVIIADQSIEPVRDAPVVKTLTRIIEARGGAVEWHDRTPPRGIAEQRHFLLGLAAASQVLYLDDDVYMEPWVLARLVAALDQERCGFIGAFPAGLSFRDDIRPEQQAVEFWEGAVRPEALTPDSPQWQRRHLHRAANQWHASRKLAPSETRLYKVAWVASCVLYDRDKLEAVGGFAFWNRLPRYHSGEDVLVQNLLMRRYGGGAIMPSGTYHTEVPSTVLNEQGVVDGHALALLPEMVERYAL